ncbi:hypothetical protein LEN26_003531 [Aphanomyces euteiches]|nr:hypothetical protein LEN26_003531 [Aphanomyces euteiches]
MDCVYALVRLEEMPSNELFQVYKYGTSINAGFQAAAFKQFFHRAIYEAKQNGSTPQINMRANSPYHHIEILLKHVHCCGQNESEILDYLAQTHDASTYWHPESAAFSFVDAVAMHRAYKKHTGAVYDMRDTTVFEIAVISVITEDGEAVPRDHLDKLKRALDSNPNLKKYKPVFLTVRPKPVVTGYCICTGAPLASPFEALGGSLE